MEKMEEDLFLDANVIYQLIDIYFSEEYFDSRQKLDLIKDREKIGLISFYSNGRSLDKEVKEIIEDFERKATILSSIYQQFTTRNLYIINNVKYQIEHKVGETLEQLISWEKALNERIQEYLFLQTKATFSSSNGEKTKYTKQNTKENIQAILSYKRMIDLLHEFKEGKGYQPSPFYKPLSQLITFLTERLNLKKEGHQSDNGTDEMVVASAFDNLIFNKRKTAIATNDQDIKRIVEVTYQIFSYLDPLTKINLLDKPNVYETNSQGLFYESSLETNFFIELTNQEYGDIAFKLQEFSEKIKFLS